MAKYVPYLSEDEIERDAAALLTECAQKQGIIIAPPIPIEDMWKSISSSVLSSTTRIAFSAWREIAKETPIFSAQSSLTSAGSSSTKASTEKRTHSMKGDIGLRSRMRAVGTGASTATCSPGTMLRGLSFGCQESLQSSAVPAKPRNEWSGRWISIHRVCSCPAD
jgi:hypothetical protein